MLCNFFHTNKKVLCISKICNKKKLHCCFFFPAALFIELERLIDAQELPKNGDGLTKPGRFDFSAVLLLLRSSIVARPLICFLFSLW